MIFIPSSIEKFTLKTVRHTNSPYINENTITIQSVTFIIPSSNCDFNYFYKVFKQYWSFVHHGSVKPGYMFPENEGQTLYDQRWKEFLDEKTQRAALTHTGINAYVRDLGLNLDPDKGLTRNDLSGGVVPIRTYF